MSNRIRKQHTLVAKDFHPFITYKPIHLNLEFLLGPYSSSKQSIHLAHTLWILKFDFSFSTSSLPLSFWTCRKSFAILLISATWKLWNGLPNWLNLYLVNIFSTNLILSPYKKTYRTFVRSFVPSFLLCFHELQGCLRLVGVIVIACSFSLFLKQFRLRARSTLDVWYLSCIFAGIFIHHTNNVCIVFKLISLNYAHLAKLRWIILL